MVKAGIIGLGKMGISHCSIIGAHPKVILTSVCDTSDIMLNAFKKYSRFQCYSDYREMINHADLDCIIVASPTKFHYDMVSLALERGLHVFCEKPFSLHLSQGILLAKKADSKKLVNQVGYHNRFLGTFRRAKEILAKGAIGKAYHFIGESYGPVVLRNKGKTWRSLRSEGGGCLYDYASHTIDLINFLLGPVTKVQGTKLKQIFSSDVEDAVFSIMTLESGISGLLSVNWSDQTYRKMSTQFTILGTEGKLIVDATELRIYSMEKSSLVGIDKGWNVINITALTDPVNFYLRGEEYSLQIDHFISQVMNKRMDNLCSFSNALETDKVISLLLEDQSKS